MNAAVVRAAYPWLPEAGRLWHIEAGVYFDAVRVSRTLGLRVCTSLGDGCGAVICDPWTRILYFLTDPGGTSGWDVPQTVPCGPSTYLVVPPLDAPENVLHWSVPPHPDRLFTEPERLRAALRCAVDEAFGPRKEST